MDVGDTPQMDRTIESTTEEHGVEAGLLIICITGGIG